MKTRKKRNKALFLSSRKERKEKEQNKINDFNKFLMKKKKNLLDVFNKKYDKNYKK